MFERLVERISRSRFAANFVIKGGLLLSSILGLDKRSTMDMDTTVVDYPLQKNKILDAMYEILNVPVDDNVSFEIVSSSSIRKDDAFNLAFEKYLLMSFSLFIPIRLKRSLLKKLETIVTRGVFNTRPRDYYDVYMLTKSVDYDLPTLKRALIATAEHRKTKGVVTQEYAQRLDVIEHNELVQSQWVKYCRMFSYAKGIPFKDVFAAVKKLLQQIFE